MLTKMTDADWVTVLRVFEASRSRRGDKGRDDKKFLSALHYFVVRFFEALAAMSDTAHLVPRFLSKSSLQGPRPYRAGGRQAQTIQTHRATLRKDRTELRLVRRNCARLHLDQIRPHSLVPRRTDARRHVPARGRLCYVTNADRANVDGADGGAIVHQRGWRSW
jgi:hypothetical protein